MSAYIGLILAILGLGTFICGAWLDYPWVELVGQMFTLVSWYYLGKAHGYRKGKHDAEISESYRQSAKELKDKTYREIYGDR